MQHCIQQHYERSVQRVTCNNEHTFLSVSYQYL